MLQQTGERQIAETLAGIKPNHRNRYQFAIDMIEKDLGRDKVILDCACGVGYGTMMLSNIASLAIGFDIEPEAINAANRAYKVDNNAYAVVDLGSADEWSRAIEHFGSIDAIVSIETIEHLVDAEELIARYSATSPYLIASVPNEVIVPFNKTSHPFHFRHYTRSQFEELLADHGYMIDVWATQYDKIPGIVYEDADDGMGFIVSARKR